MQKYIEKIPSKLILLGDGPELVQMRQLTKELNVEEDVLFLGKQDCVSRFIDCLTGVVISEKESFATNFT